MESEGRGSEALTENKEEVAGCSTSACRYKMSINHPHHCVRNPADTKAADQLEDILAAAVAQHAQVWGLLRETLTKERHLP